MLSRLLDHTKKVLLEDNLGHSVWTWATLTRTTAPPTAAISKSPSSPPVQKLGAFNRVLQFLGGRLFGARTGNTIPQTEPEETEVNIQLEADHLIHTPIYILRILLSNSEGDRGRHQCEFLNGMGPFPKGEFEDSDALGEEIWDTMRTFNVPSCGEGPVVAPDPDCSFMGKLIKITWD
jgi:hypothetical protein